MVRLTPAELGAVRAVVWASAAVIPLSFWAPRAAAAALVACYATMFVIMQRSVRRGITGK